MRAYRLVNYRGRMVTLFRRFELADKKKKFGDELSKGMQQNETICILRAAFVQASAEEMVKNLGADLFGRLCCFWSDGCAGSICHKCGSGSFVPWSFTAFSVALR